ncbi:hypothetical protein GCM10023196_092980 [Actinoallomurus vinaceus]|uniref:Uncharacterized protein n=1 Tax=Actinoallomurus vinaceus TaxID=1080074 RepID=A0ABP8UQZ6_9ACTN
MDGADVPQHVPDVLRRCVDHDLVADGRQCAGFLPEGGQVAINLVRARWTSHLGAPQVGSIDRDPVLFNEDAGPVRRWETGLRHRYVESASVARGMPPMRVRLGR